MTDPSPGPVSPETFARHARFVRTLAAQLLASDDLAADVVQEAWLAASHRAPASADTLRAWFRTVTRRLSGRMRRSEARRARVEQLAARAEPVPSTAELAEQQSLMRELTDAVLDLEEPYREVIWLRFYEERTPGEIANRLDVPRGTVYTRLRRGLERLRARLDPDGRGGVSRSLVLLAGLPAVPRRRAPWPRSRIRPSLLAAATVVVGLGLAWQALPDRTADRGGSSSSAAGEMADLRHAPPPTAVPTPLRTEVLDRETTSHEIPSTTADEPGADSFLVRWSATGTPAARRRLQCFRFDGVVTYDVRVIETDDQGRARWPSASASRPGTGEFPWQVVDPLTGAGGPGPEPGSREGPWTLELPDGRTVRGRVVAADGSPVSEARLWLASRTLPAGLEIGRTDRDGWFELTGVAGTHDLGAWSPDHAASSLQEITELRDSVGPLTILLGRDPGELNGRVTDRAGEPVARAVVKVQAQPAVDRHQPDGTLLHGAVPLEAGTDGAGRFRVGGVPSGWVEVRITAEGFADLHRFVEARDVRVDLPPLTLDRGRVLRGVALDPTNLPVSAARVEVLGAEGVVLSSRGTARDGGFRVDGLLAGQRVRVYHPAVGVAELDVVAGEDELSWEATLRSEHVLRGEVLDHDRRPVVGRTVLVRASARSTPWRAQVPTDDTGRFEFHGCPAGPLVVAVTGPLASGVAALRHDLESVPDTRLALVLEEGRDAATLSGRLLDADGRPLRGEVQLLADLEGSSAEWRTWRVTSDERGHFRIASVPPGDHGLSACAAGQPLQFLRTVLVPDTEAMDLGALTLPRPGRLVLDCTAPGFDTFQIMGNGNLRNYDLREVDSLDLPPGSYAITLWGPERGMIQRQVTLEAGDTASLGDLRDTHPGIPFELCVDGGSPGTRIGVSVSRNEQLLGHFWEPARPGVTWSRRLVPGDYRLDLQVGESHLRRTFRLSEGDVARHERVSREELSGEG